MKIEATGLALMIEAVEAAVSAMHTLSESMEIAASVTGTMIVSQQALQTMLDIIWRKAKRPRPRPRSMRARARMLARAMMPPR